MNRRRSAAGAAQLRQREHMAQRGWASITTFIRWDTKQFLKELQEARGLGSLHEALDLALRQHAGEVASLDKAGSAKRERDGGSADRPGSETAAAGSAERRTCLG